MALVLNPLARSSRKASSRFGPLVPAVPAWFKVWQAPHLATNNCLPLTSFDTGCLSEHPASANADTVTAAISPTKRCNVIPDALTSAALYRAPDDIVPSQR